MQKLKKLWHKSQILEYDDYSAWQTFSLVLKVNLSEIICTMCLSNGLLPFIHFGKAVIGIYATSVPVRNVN